MIDPDTGTREKILGFDKSGATCSVTSQKAVYVGRTQYTIMMVDIKQKEKKWNVTFYDYTATQMTKEMINNYGTKKKTSLYVVLIFFLSQTWCTFPRARPGKSLLWIAVWGSCYGRKISVRPSLLSTY